MAIRELVIMYSFKELKQIWVDLVFLKGKDTPFDEYVSEHFVQVYNPEFEFLGFANKTKGEVNEE